jgi:hypothetical protein
MYSKIRIDPNNVESSGAESLADLLLEIGNDLVQKRQLEIGVKWLERSYDALAQCDLDQLSRDAGELKLSITQSLGNANQTLEFSLRNTDPPKCEV